MIHQSKIILQNKMLTVLGVTKIGEHTYKYLIFITIH